jgi:hypothetical protein
MDLMDRMNCYSLHVKITENFDIDFCVNDNPVMLKMYNYLKYNNSFILSEFDCEYLEELIIDGADIDMSLIIAIYFWNNSSRFLINYYGASMYDEDGSKITEFYKMCHYSPISRLSLELSELKKKN